MKPFNVFPYDSSIDFMRMRWVSVSIAALLMLVSIGAMVTKGFNFALDFTGGIGVELRYDKAPDVDVIRENLERAGHGDAAAHLVLAEDAFAYLARAAKKGERFDVVVLDPPSYSTSKKRRFVAEQHYGELAAEALGVLAPGGRLFASTNHRGTSRAKLRRVLFAAAEAASVPVAQLKDLAPGSDFPAAPGEEPSMKAMLLTAAREGAVAKRPGARAEGPRPAPGAARKNRPGRV